MADPRPQSNPQASQSTLTKISDNSATFLNEAGEEVYVPEQEEGVEVEEEYDDLIELPSLDDEISDEDAPPEEDDEPEIREPDEKFKAYFEKQTGMPIEEFSRTLNEIKLVVAELGADGLKEGVAFIKASREAAAIEDARKQLDTFWGVDREETIRRYEAIKPYFQRLSPEKKKLYDTVEGADLLWRSVQAQGVTKTQTTKNSKNAGNKRFMFTQAEIDAMSPEEYAQKAEAINKAYINNQVGF